MPPTNSDIEKENGIVVSLCDKSGNMVVPWAENGYTCYAVDIDNTERTEEVGQGKIHYKRCDIREWECPDRPVRIGFAFPPCTHLAISGARWFQEKGLQKLADAIELVAECHETLTGLDCPWFIENPVSTLSTYWREPDYKFNPYEFDGYTDNDEQYTKETWLWTGNNFKMPVIDGVSEDAADNRIHSMPPSEDRSEKRSVTPTGFARAVYLAHEKEGYARVECQTTQQTFENL